MLESVGHSEIKTDVGGTTRCWGQLTWVFCTRPLCPVEMVVLVDEPEDLSVQLHVVEGEVHTGAKRSSGEGCRSLYSNASAPAELQTYSCLLSLFHSYVELVAFFHSSNWLCDLWQVTDLFCFLFLQL